MKTKNVSITLDANEVIEKVKQKYGSEPCFTEKAKKIKNELEENKDLKEQIKSLKK